MAYDILLGGNTMLKSKICNMIKNLNIYSHINTKYYGQLGILKHWRHSK